MNFDAVIIGAGVVGGSVAFQMADAGLKVALVDRSFPGSGTSRATQAGIGVYSKNPRANLEINMKGAELYPLIAARLDSDIELQMRGVLNVTFDEGGFEKMRAFVAKQRETPGYEAKIISGDEARELEPALSPEVVGAALCQLDGEVNGMLYTEALARGVARLGGKVLAETEVLDLEAVGDRSWRLSTSQGDIEARWVVNCAGIHSPHIGRMVGVDIPIQPNKGHVLVTEAVPPMLTRRISGPTLIRQTVHGNFLLGQSEEMLGYDRTENLLVLTAQAKTARRVLPALEKVKTIRSFVGLRPWPPDKLPIIGEAPGHPGFLIAVGHSGVTWSPAAGKLLTEFVTTGQTSMPLEPYSLARFRGTEAPAVA